MAVFISSDTECTNCKHALSGNYCSNCGQKGGTKRLELKTLVSDIFKAVVDVDTKVFRTIKELTLNPGQVTLNYIGGARVRYLNPIKYCFVIFAITLALMHLTGNIDQTVERVEFDNIERLEKERNLSEEALAETRAFQQATLEVYTEYLQPIQFILIPIAAFFLRWMHYKRRRNYIEIVSFLSYVFAHAALMSIPILLGMTLLGEISNFSLWIYSALSLIFIGYGAKVFFGLSWVRLFLSLLIYVPLYIVLVGILMSAAASLRISGII